jgi:hypothetical protein
MAVPGKIRLPARRTQIEAIVFFDTTHPCGANKSGRPARTAAACSFSRVAAPPPG